MKTKKRTTKISADLPDTIDDKKHLQPDEGRLDLPDVKDIPGQEHIHVPAINEFVDTTISSDDEEGVDIFDKFNDIAGETNVTPDEKRALRDASEKSGNVADDENLERARLDNRDEDGELLNERVDLSGSDLDLPQGEDDDEDEGTVRK